MYELNCISVQITKVRLKLRKNVIFLLFEFVEFNLRDSLDF